MKKAIIAAAITGGIHTPTMSPYLPITPRQIIDEILAVHQAGGTVCHVHVRDPETGKPVLDTELYKEILTEVKRRCDIIICITTGGGLGMATAERVQGVIDLSPMLASFNASSINFALFHTADRWEEWKYDWEPGYLQMTEDYIFSNTFKTTREFCALFNEQNTKPELEIYDSGMINNAVFLINKGYIKKPVYLQFVNGVVIIGFGRR